MLKKFEFQGLKQSYAWNSFFEAMQAAQDSTRETFSDLFCQDKFVSEEGPVMEEGKPKYTARKDGKGFFLTKQVGDHLVVFIDTQKEVGFRGAQVSADGVLWKHSETPVQGKLFIDMGEQDETYIDKEVGESIDLDKASKAINDVVSLKEAYPALPFKRKKSSPMLLASEMNNLGVSYQLQYGATEADIITLKSAVTILSEGENQFYQCSIPLNVGDILIVGGNEVQIQGCSGAEVRLSEPVSAGIYDVRVRSTKTPWIQSAPNYVNLALNPSMKRDREHRDLIESVFQREKPFRLNGSVIYLDSQLMAPINIKTELKVDRKPNLFFVDRQGNPVAQVRIGWQEGAATTVFIHSKNLDEVRLSFDSQELSVTPELTTNSKKELVLKVMIPNREYKEKTFILTAEADHYNGELINKVVEKLLVIQEEWNPVIVTDFNITDGVDFSDKSQLTNAPVIVDYVTFDSEQHFNNGLNVTDQVAFTDEPEEEIEGFSPQSADLSSEGGSVELEFNFSSDWTMIVEDSDKY